MDDSTNKPKPPAPTAKKTSKRKDMRRRPPSGNPGGQPKALTPRQVAELEERVRQCWTQPRIMRHYSEAWGVCTTVIFSELRKIFKTFTEAYNAIPIEERAAQAVEEMRAHVAFCYDEYKKTGDPHVLRGVPVTLSNLSKITGVLSPQNVRHEGNVNVALSPGDLNSDQLKARIAELFSKHGDKLK